MICDWWISIRFVYFCVSRFVACDRTRSGLMHLKWSFTQEFKKIKENHAPSGPKSGHDRWRRQSFSRGSNCKALTGKIFVFWIGCHLWEVSLTRGGHT